MFHSYGYVDITERMVERENERERESLEKVGRGSDGERKRENRGRRVGDKEGTEREGRNTGRGER